MPIYAAMIPVLAVGLFLVAGIFIYGAEPQIPLLLGAVVAGLVGVWRGYRWKTIEHGITDSIARAIPALIILLIIGMIIGVWIASGVVPAMIYYGFDVLLPDWFLPATFLLCSLMSLATGSSWTTAGTVGVAAIGVGQGLGIPAAAVAGAIVSGSFFGDKISPLSDTTNLTPAVVGVELYDHIKHMLYSTAPAFLITLVIYTFLGAYLTNSGEQGGEVMRYRQVLADNFSLSPLLLIPPLAVIGMIIFKVPAIPSLVAGALLGGLMQIIVQGQGPGAVATALYHGFVIDTGWDRIDHLLSRGGMASMYSTVSLGIVALAFGGIMDKCGMLHALVSGMAGLVRRTGNLVLTTVSTAFLINIFAANQYLAVIIPGQMFEEAYRRLNLHNKNLSRALESGGTLTAPLIPWNSSGVFMYSVLAVSPLAFAPYAVLCWLVPLIVVLYGYTGFSMERSVPPIISQVPGNNI